MSSTFFFYIVRASDRFFWLNLTAFPGQWEIPMPHSAVELDLLTIETVYCGREGKILLMVTFLWFISVLLDMVMEALFEGAPGTIVLGAVAIAF